MGFTSGFTGGVTLTLGLAYLTVLAHQRSREQQAAVLRRQTYALTAIHDPLPPTLPPTRAELAAAERAHVAEAAKDRWNAEVEGAVRWVQSADWDAVQRRLGDSLCDLLGLSPSSSSSGSASAAAQAAAASAEAAEQDVSAAARAAYTRAKDTAIAAEHRAEEAARAALARGKQAVGAVAGAARVQAGDESPEARALSQRYQPPTPPAQQPSVEEVLAARYLPVDQRDQTQLRAV